MTKPGTLSKKIHETLLKPKGKKMSFLDMVMKLVGETGKKRDFKSFAGSMRVFSKTLEELKSKIAEDRERNMEYP